MAAIAVALTAVASNVLFPSSLIAFVGVLSIVTLVSAVIIAKSERDNELYADLKAMTHCNDQAKIDIFDALYKTQ